MESITTIQETGKRLKLHTIGAVIMLVVGLLWFFENVATMSMTNEPPSKIATTLMVSGFIWYIITRFRIWWHHK